MSTTTIHPLRDVIFVIQKEAPEKTEGGIFIPETAQEKMRPLYGAAAFCGPKSSINPGETVAFGQYSGIPFEHDGIKYLILKEADVIAIL